MKIKLPKMKKRTQRILTLSALGAAVLVLCTSAFFMQKKDSLRLNGQFRVSLLGDHSDFSGRCRMHYDDRTGEVSLKSSQKSMLLSGVPVYSLTEETLYLSTGMSYSDFAKGKLKRLNRFATVKQNDGKVLLSPDGRREFEAGGYLHNGKDVYLFLEPVTVRWGKEMLPLSELSYMTVMGTQGFYYYDPKTQKEAFVNGFEDTVYAEAGSGAFTLNLSNDSVDLPNGKSFLLTPNPESYGILEE